MMTKTIYILTLIILILTSCKNQINFDSEKWKIEKDLETYPYREEMLNDIIDNNLFIGDNYKTVIDSLGQPENILIKEKNKLYFIIETDYGWDIDPVYTKYLKLTMGNDSTITKVEIYEWKK